MRIRASLSVTTRRTFLATVLAFCGVSLPSAKTVRQPRVALTVRLGTLTAEEFSALETGDQALIEESTRKLLRTYGAAWFVRHRVTLRADCSFFCGVP
jgi:hypothetical protein